MSYKPNSESVERLKAILLSLGAITILQQSVSWFFLLLLVAGAVGLVLRGGRG